MNSPTVNLRTYRSPEGASSDDDAPAPPGSPFRDLDLAEFSVGHNDRRLTDLEEEAVAQPQRRLSLRGQRKARRASVLWKSIASLFAEKASVKAVEAHRRLTAALEDGSPFHKASYSGLPYLAAKIGRSTLGQR